MYADGMSKRLFQMIAGLVLLLGMLAPLGEFFDHWDKPIPSHDTELSVAARLVGLGFVAAICGVVQCSLTRERPAPCGDRAPGKEPAHRTMALERPETTGLPPPLSLRI